MSDNASATFGPGWYPDPQDSSIVRWWDGRQWTAHTQPRHPVTPSPAQETTQPGQASATKSKIPLFGGKRKAEELQAALDSLGGMDYAQIQEATANASARLDEIRGQLSQAQEELRHAQAQIINVRSAFDLQEVGLFDYEHPAESSASLSAELASVQQQIKECIRAKRATNADVNFIYGGSVAKGRKFVADMSKAFLAAYNSEAENCIKSVRAGNLTSAQARLNKIADQIATMGKMIGLTITTQYHRLRLQELSLASRHLEAVKREKEDERERRAEQREQEKAERELQAERARLEKEKQHYVNALGLMRQRGDEAGAADLEAKLADVEKAITDVDFRAANIKAGYVYVISNVGAFGPDVVKIGLTRRLEPMDRVRELGDASVPFRFDVHALFFAEDAVSIETMLHRQFASQRINRINSHREFFRVTPQQVLDALQASNVHLVEYTVEPQAEEFRLSGGNVTTGDQQHGQ